MSSVTARADSRPAAAEEAARPRAVLAVVSVAVFVAGLDLFIVNVAFPDIARDFPDSSLSDLSWVLNAYAIVYGALLVPAGRLADRLGRRRVFLVGLVLFVTASAACAAAPSLPVLIGARVVQAAGAALLTPSSLALLLDEFPPARWSAAIGVWAAMGGIAAAAGPPLGGLLVEASWRWVFLVNLPIGLLAVARAVKVLRESRDEQEAGWPDVLGTALLTAAIAILSLGLVRAPDWGWSDPRTAASLGGAAIAIAALVARSASHPRPVLELDMLRVRAFSMASVAALLFYAGFAAMLLGNVLFLTEVWQDSILQAGLALSPGPLAAAALAVPAGHLVDRVGPRALGGLGSFLFAAGCAWWALRIEASPAYASTMLPGLLVGGAGVGLTLPSLSSAAVAALPPARLATGSAVLTMARQVGAVLGVAILIAVFGNPGRDELVGAFQDGWVFMTIVSAAAAIAAFGIGRLPERASGQAAEGSA